MTFRFKSLALVPGLVLALSLAGCQGGEKPAGGSPSASPSAPAVTAAPSPSAAAPTAAPTTAPGSPAPKPTGVGQPLQAAGEVTAVRLADPQSGWTAGNGWIAHTADGGQHWESQYTGDGKVTQLFALNGQKAWAVTDKGQLLATTDGGASWKAAGQVPNQGFLHFVSDTEAFAGNARSTDGGKTWTTLKAPAGIVGDAYFHDKANGWAVTASPDKAIIQRTTDGGAAWKPVKELKLAAAITGTVIRSAGEDDAWVELIGQSGMTQTSYSLFHTTDGGKAWKTVLANSTAGGGPAPGFPLNYNDGPKNNGSKPGMLYVVNRTAAFMGGYCPACDNPNSVGKTTDGGATWVNGKDSVPGTSGALLAMADASKGWLITNDASQPSVFYTTTDGGSHWTKVSSFPPAKKAS
ncbi:hypothetical protein MJA45_27390 [Paenibacillus aurantius]|uniref:Photosynthesis system II assembly factor Ycf48/Hcf136-like domain-containing protein n=1 Tax=Paenibacillus aurantius TaxID=2918900 RepID=A0AA96RHM7_9BACL|nr:hypothetical protein [Paenibacillus aurantius]WNQ11279.1 hypothetical protein MJA45_27390 [Paenibacillus aurantius]